MSASLLSLAIILAAGWLIARRPFTVAGQRGITSMPCSSGNHSRCDGIILDAHGNYDQPCRCRVCGDH